MYGGLNHCLKMKEKQFLDFNVIPPPIMPMFPMPTPLLVSKIYYIPECFKMVCKLNNYNDNDGKDLQHYF